MPEQHPLPWITQSKIDEITAAFNNTHAILLNGPQAIGKSYLVTDVCLDLLTKVSSDQSTNLIKAGTHPDLHVLTSAFSYNQLDERLQNAAMRYLDIEALEKKRLSRQISVDSIRSLVNGMHKSAALGGYKLTVIYPAEDMNNNSANALLKFLEEPTDRTLIILISHDISKLPATIRSRCMRINVGLPAINESQQWLKLKHADIDEQAIANTLNLAANRPLLANQYLLDSQQLVMDDLINDIEQLVATGPTNIVAIAKKWMKLKQTDFILSWLCLLLSDVIKAKSTDAKIRQNSVYQKRLVNIAKMLSITKLYKMYDYFIDINKRYDGVTDETLLLEDVILTLTGISKAS